MVTAEETVETRVYVAVGSDVLTLAQVSATLGLAPTSGWSVGDPTMTGRIRDGTSFEVYSSQPLDVAPADHLRELIATAEHIADAVVASEGVLDYPRLELVVVFPRTGGTQLVELDERWIRALGSMNAWLDIDQYINDEPSDVDRPSMPDDLMIGQTLLLTLRPLQDPAAEVIEVTSDPRNPSEIQEVLLRQVLAKIESVPAGGYELSIRQHMIAKDWTETGFSLGRATIRSLIPAVRRVRVHTTVTEPT